MTKVVLNSVTKTYKYSYYFTHMYVKRNDVNTSDNVSECPAQCQMSPESLEPLLPETCYICLEECDTTSPCKCQAIVHPKCLWAFNRKTNQSKCTICQRKLDTTWSGHCVLCIVVLILLFLLACALAGFGGWLQCHWQI